MPADTPQAAHSPQREGLDRRTFMKTVGTTAGAAATIGAAGELEIVPVGEADAIGVLGTVLLFSGASAAAGVGLVGWEVLGTGDNPDGSSSDVIEDFIYNNAVAVAEGRSAWSEEMHAQYLNASVGESPFANAAWQNIRAEVVTAAVNGESESTAEQNAIQSLNDQATVSVVNVAERFNTGLSALIESMVLDVENTIESMQSALDAPDVRLSAVSDPTTGFETEGTWNPISASSTGSGHVVFETPLSLPGSLPEGEDQDRTLMGYFMSGDSDRMEAPAQADSAHTNNWTGGQSYSSSQDLIATHRNLSDKTVLDTDMFDRIIAHIYEEHSSISSNLSTYVSNVYARVEEGAIDPEDVLGSQDIVDEFSDSDAQTRFGAEMLAIGSAVPSQHGYQAKISHPDLSTDLWGDLYPRFSGDPVSVKPGTTIASADYDVAYFGFHSENTGEYVTRVLSGTEDLEIFDVDDLPDEEEVGGDSFGSSADDNSNVVVYEGEDPPDAIEFHQDHSGWSVAIYGATNTSTHSPTEISVDGTTYTVEATSLNAGEAVDSVRLIPPVEYDKPVDSVTDPTNPDNGETAERLDQLRKTVDDLKDAYDEGGGIGLPNLGDFGAGGVVAGVAALFAVFWGAGKVLGDDS